LRFFSDGSNGGVFCQYRDGVSESQFNQVLNIELDQIIEVHKLIIFAIYVVYVSVMITNFDF